MTPTEAPGHTDLMVSPESLDAYLAANPPPVRMTPAERKALERERRQAAGLVRLEVYVRPEVREKVRAFAEKQNRGLMYQEHQACDGAVK